MSNLTCAAGAPASDPHPLASPQSGRPFTYLKNRQLLGTSLLPSSDELLLELGPSSPAPCKEMDRPLEEALSLSAMLWAFVTANLTGRSLALIQVIISGWSISALLTFWFSCLGSCHDQPDWAFSCPLDLHPALAWSLPSKCWPTAIIKFPLLRLQRLLRSSTCIQERSGRCKIH